MRTFQDFLKSLENETAKENFIYGAICEHKESERYKIAIDAEEYMQHRNPTIMRVQKYVYDAMHRAHINPTIANNKIASRFFPIIITQEVQTLLGNGVGFAGKDTKEKLGKTFDQKIQKLAETAAVESASFAFWNVDHVEVFGLKEFVPLLDEETGALRAGIRFWRVDPKKPMRITLFEEEGYTEYILNDIVSGNKTGNHIPEIYKGKLPYKIHGFVSAAGGFSADRGENYSTLPIVPLYYIRKQSEIEHIKQQIDAYDLMLSHLVNNISDCDIIYWILKNCDGMSDGELTQFIERLAIDHVANVDNDHGEIEPHTVEVPFQASETALELLRERIFEDAMAADIKKLSAGNVTATEIKASYELLNKKLDKLEMLVTEMICGILELAGIDDVPTYTRSQIINAEEAINMIVSSGNLLPNEYKTRKILEVLGDADRADEILNELNEEEQRRYVPSEDVNIVENEVSYIG